jgi:glycosyltransferase involved in cell wall biosynthesis
VAPTVSVVLPVRDGGRWLATAVESILAQTFTDLELLVVDDHSRDGAVAALPGADARLRRLHSAGDGVSAAFNTGLGAAVGRFVARMDADDIALPARLEQQLDYLQRHPDVAICGACVEIFHGGGARPAGGNRRYEAWLNGCRTPEAIARELYIECPLPNPTALFRREALTALGGYADPEWPEDYDLFLRAAALDLRMGKPDPVLLRWREHEGRLTRSDPRYERDRFQAAKAHFLARGPLRGRDAVVIWGAGPGGRRMHDLLQAEGITAAGFIDVHPRRVGGLKRGLPVWPLAQLPRLDHAFVLAAVGAVGARRRIRAFMKRHGRLEGQDYLFVL